MTIPESRSNKTRTAFIDARIVRSRVVKETTSSVPARPATEPKQIQVTAATNAQFEVSIADTTNPKDFLIDCDYHVTIKDQGSDKVLIEYEAKHAGHFIVIASTGISDWTETPPEAFGLCFSTLQYIAQRQAENTLAAMGLAGIALPSKVTFDDETPQVEEEQKVAIASSSTKNES